MGALKSESGSIVKSVGEINERLNIPVADVDDRNKSDLFAKTIALTQTTWFTIQCLARWIKHLPLTELEVVTLAFAVLNIVTYVLWWDKPQNVEVPISLRHYEKSRGGPERRTMTVAAFSRFGRFGKWLSIGAGMTLRLDTSRRSGLNQTLLSPEISAPQVTGPFDAGNTATSWNTPYSEPMACDVTTPEITAEEDSTLTFDPFMNCDDPSLPYYSSVDGTGWDICIPISIIAVFCGAVHLLPLWTSSFPSSFEEFMWRVCAIWTTAAPALLLFGPIYFGIPNSLEILKFIVTLFMFIVFASFLLARCIVVVLAFTTLRDAPPAVYQSIVWTSFIPHV